MTDTIHDISFPKRLECGEVVIESCYIRPQSREIYAKVIAKDEDATIQVVVSTTIGVLYRSNEYKVSKLLENFHFALPVSVMLYP